MSLIILMLLSGCAELRTVDEKLDAVVIYGEDQHCGHSKEHRELYLDEINEKLKQSRITWECRGQ